MIIRGTAISVATFGEYLHFVSGDTSWLDDECGSVDYSGWYGRIGRHIIMVDGQGNQWGPETFATETEAAAAFETIRDNVDYSDDRPEGYWYGSI